MSAVVRRPEPGADAVLVVPLDECHDDGGVVVRPLRDCHAGADDVCGVASGIVNVEPWVRSRNTASSSSRMTAADW
jgi:hypothetical protein